jgi:putative transposase
METDETTAGKPTHLVSRTGVALTRSVTFQVALDPTLDQRILLAKCAGARRFAFNHHIGRVKENLDVRTKERDDVADEYLTPGLSWSKFSFINEFNAWKNGTTDDAPENEGGNRGLSWRHEIPESVFECASADAAQSLKNWTESKNGTRLGAKVGFPRFAAKGRSTPSFRLRNRRKVEETQAIRFADATHLRLPKLGPVKVLGPTRKIRRMIDLGRFHVYSATVTQRGGRWLVSLTGVAAEFHHAQRSTQHHHSPVGVDRGIKSLAVCADADGAALVDFEGVKELRKAERSLIVAQKALARTTRGSKGREQARVRLNRRHRNVAVTRRHLVHQASSYLVRHCTTVVLEDLDVASMTKNRRLAKAVSDAAMGELRRQIEYKATWYGTEVVIADRWFPSSKLCSGCGEVKAQLGLSERVYVCEHCDLCIDRDLNAAINLARWSPAAHVST